MSVYIITHKYIEDKHDLSNLYKWLYVGAFRQHERQDDYLYDDTGENISEKNNHFCELTGIYWIRHNIQETIKGQVHYRRFFTHNVWNKDSKYYYTDGEIEKLLEEYDCIVGDKYYLPVSVRENYEKDHHKDDLDLLQQIVREKEPDYLSAFEDAWNEKYFFPFNMFVASDRIYDAYVDWLFGLLFELEKRCNLEDHDAYQARVFGFLSERMLNVWLIKNNVNYVELPVVTIGTSIKYKFRTSLEKRFKTSFDGLVKLDDMIFAKRT